MPYYDLNRVLCSEESPFRWHTDKENSLTAKTGSAVVFDLALQKWRYQSTEKKAWNDYLQSIGRLKLADSQKLDASGNVVSKSEEELLTAGLLSLSDLKASRTAEVNRICQEKIVSGFTSSALGSAHYYDSEETDQLNLIGSVASGISVLYKCRNIGTDVTAYVTHTNTQIKQVLRDGAERKTFLLQNAMSLKNSISSAADITALNAVYINFGWD